MIEVSNFKLKITKDESGESGTYNSEGGSKIGRSLETTIKIKDGETIFIGGLKKATVHNLDSKIPFLVHFLWLISSLKIKILAMK